MKKLFSINDDGSFFVEVEGAVYSTFSHSANKHTFYDCNGNVLKNYSRPRVEYEETAEICDPDFFREISEGFYVYTTHEVTPDPDGAYGRFGIKYNNGKKLTEEIYYQVGWFCNGLCSVCIEDGKWGCIDTNGNLVIPYNCYDSLIFNKYGVAVGNDTLIDRTGNAIPDTALNSIDECSEYDRYFVFSLLTDEQAALTDKYGTAPNITVDIYDTKNRACVIKGIPEGRLDVYSFDGEPKVITAAAKFLHQYDNVHLSQKGTILCRKNGTLTVYDFYQ